MYEFKGTKGEWYVFDNGESFYPGIECRTDNGIKTIVVYGDRGELEGVRSNQDATTEVKLANAHLIAAAPLLLQACIDLVAGLWGRQGTKNEMTIMSDEYNAIDRAIREALNITK